MQSAHHWVQRSVLGYCRGQRRRVLKTACWREEKVNVWHTYLSFLEKKMVTHTCPFLQKHQSNSSIRFSPIFPNDLQITHEPTIRSDGWWWVLPRAGSASHFSLISPIMTQPLILRWKPWQRFTAAPHRTSSAPHSGSPKLDTRIVLSPKIHPPTLYLVVTTQDPTPLSPTAPDRCLCPKKHLILLGGVRPWRTALLVICQYTGIGIFNGRSLKNLKK